MVLGGRARIYRAAINLNGVNLQGSKSEKQSLGRIMPGFRPFRFAIAFGLGLGLCLATIATPKLLAQTRFDSLQTDRVVASISQSNSTPTPAAIDATGDPLREGKRLYDLGQLPGAEQALQQALQQAQGPEDRAIVLSNLALVQGQQGNWSAAEQSIATGLGLLESGPASERTQHQSLLAQSLNVQGRLLFGQGQADGAFTIWRRAEAIYRSIDDFDGIVRSRLRQARALQSLGFYRRSVDEILWPLGQLLQSQPDSLAKSTSLRSLGEALQVISPEVVSLTKSVSQSPSQSAPQLKSAKDYLQASLTSAEAIQNSGAIATAKLSLANAIYGDIIDSYNRGAIGPAEQRETAKKLDRAIQLYQSVRSETGNPINSIRATLNQLNLWLDLSEVDTKDKAIVDRALTEASALAPNISGVLATLPNDRPGIETRINGAHLLRRLKQLKPSIGINYADIQRLLDQSQTLAEASGDRRYQAQILGEQGAVAIEQQDLIKAFTQTERAISLAKAVNAPDVLYRQQERLGKLLEKRGDSAGAIAAYNGAITTLASLRSDLVGTNPEVLFSFQKSVDPIHRNLLRLLLQSNGNKPSQDTLKRARGVLESLQREEITNFLQAACLRVNKVALEQVNSAQQTAIVYPFVLADRVATITSFPGQDGLELDSYPIAEAKIKGVIGRLRDRAGDSLLNRASWNFTTDSDLLYHAIFTPKTEALLKQNKTETIVFVLDGQLRNIPMAALYNEADKKFLIENYSIAITPGLELTDPKALGDTKLSAIAFGYTQSGSQILPNGQSYDYPALEFVTDEIDNLKKQLQTESIQDKDFTVGSFESILSSRAAPVVHLATHGQFSSNKDETFLLASDGFINIDTLSETLQKNARLTATPLELLVMSACETASGDDRAALGLAGVALRSGARSTVASLWPVDDQATSVLMDVFYQQIKGRASKAKALQQAQLALMKQEGRDHPYFWASFILIGNWL
jgi:CHAT domain-containing protein/predicted negative regulator of RcsB-dependent stress response